MKIDEYRKRLRGMDEWEPYLLRLSGLPGPRGNLELARAVAEEGDLARFEHYLEYTAEIAPTNTPEEFLAFCGALGLGRLLAAGERQLLGRLRKLASDTRWRSREAVAMGLQLFGDADMVALLAEMQRWLDGSWLEQRAVVAGLCEPRLLKVENHATRVVGILDRVTENLHQAVDRKDEDFRTLRQALGYGWSVAVVAAPQAGRKLMEKWMAVPDPGVRWVMKENLKKKRLCRMDSGWVDACLRGLEKV